MKEGRFVSMAGAAILIAGSLTALPSPTARDVASRIESVAVDLQAAVATEISAALNTSGVMQAVAQPAAEVAPAAASSDPIGDALNEVGIFFRRALGILLAPIMVPLSVVGFAIFFGCLDGGMRGLCGFVRASFDTFGGLISFLYPPSPSATPAAAEAGRGPSPAAASAAKQTLPVSTPAAAAVSADKASAHRPSRDDRPAPEPAAARRPAAAESAATDTAAVGPVGPVDPVDPAGVAQTASVAAEPDSRSARQTAAAGRGDARPDRAARSRPHQLQRPE